MTVPPRFADLPFYLAVVGLFVLSLSVLGFSALAVPLASHAQTPTVDRVEPAHWWTGMQWNEVQLMVYGTHLDAVSAHIDGGGAEVSAVHSLPNASYAFMDVRIAPDADPHFLSRWADVLQAEYPDLSIVGEVWDTAPPYTAMYQAGSPLSTGVETHLPSVMDFALSIAFREYLSGDAGLSGVYQVLAQDFLYGDPMNVMTLIDNHDMPRAAYLAEGNIDRLEQVLTMLLTLRGIPQILYGTEIGMIGGTSHVELRADYPGGFPGDEQPAFTAEGRTELENRVYNSVRELLHLRQRHISLRRGRLVQYPPTYGHPVYTHRRVHEEEEILVVINGSDEARRVNLVEELNHHAGPVPLVDLRTDAPYPYASSSPGSASQTLTSTDPADDVPVIEIAPRDALLLRVVDENK